MKKLFSLLFLAAISFTATAQETVTISPTWGQSFKWANNTVWIVVGIILIAFAILYLIKYKDDGKLGIMIFAFVLFAGGTASILSKPAAVKWNNDKKVDKAYLERVGEQHVWDSLQNNCLIVDGPYKCK